MNNSILCSVCLGLGVFNLIAGHDSSPWFAACVVIAAVGGDKK